MSRILVIDDESKIREVLCSYLEHAGHQVIQAASGRLGLAALSQHQPDLVVLDLMLPDQSGEEVCQIIRRGTICPDLPVLMLTAKVDEESKLQGFKLGADDYLTKPFSPRELVARVQALLKRSGHPPGSAKDAAASPAALAPGKLRWSADRILCLDPASCRLSRRGTAIELTATEYRLMATFLDHPERVFSREDLVRIALGDDFDGSDRTVDAHIKNLRHKIEDDPRQPRWIQTVHGFGYRLSGG